MSIESIVSLVFATLGVGLLAAGLIAGLRERAVMAWPAVEAEVVSSELYERRNDLIFRSGRPVVFRYRVNGVEHTSRGALRFTPSGYKARRQVGEKYAPGSRHTIRYCPDDPQRIRFGVGRTMESCFLPVVLGGMGLVFIGVGVVSFLVLRS